MRVVIQRVKEASVKSGGAVTGRIESGLLVYLGVAVNDSESDAIWLAKKIAFLRIFNDSAGKMNLSLKDINGNETAISSAPAPAGVLVISQFTLFADARKGRRPSWNGAASPEKAKYLYEYFIESVKKQGLVCESGEFQTHMEVTYTNDGPVTIILDSISSEDLET